MQENQVLAISWSFPPLIGARSIQVGRSLHYLAKAGWGVTLITAKRGMHGLGAEYDDELAAIYAEGIEIIQVPVPILTMPAQVFRGLFPKLALAPDDQLFWAKKIINYVSRNLSERTFSHLISFGVPWSDHLAGREIKVELGVPWIAHFSDPWVDNPYRKERARAQEEAQMEENVVRSADALIFTNQATAVLTMSKFPSAWRSKAHAIPHGYDPNNFRPKRMRAAGPRKAQLEIVHVGNLYGLRSPEGLLMGLKKLQEKAHILSRIKVSLVGFTKNRQHWNAFLEENKLQGQVSFSKTVGYMESLEKANAADVLLIIDAPLDQKSVFLPSKIVDYLSLGKPILGVTPKDSVTAEVLGAFDMPLAAPDDPKAIANAIEKLVGDWDAGRLGVGSNFAVQRETYNIEKTTSAFEKILKGLNREGN